MHRTWGGSLQKLFQRERRAMRKDNIIEERFETVKKLVHDDPTAINIVERFHKEFSETEKFRRKIYAVAKASIIMAAISFVSFILLFAVGSGNVARGILLFILSLIFYGIAYITAKPVSIIFSSHDIEYVNACLEERCPNTSAKYPVVKRAGKFFAKVDGKMRLLDKPYPDAPSKEDSYVYYEYPLYQLDEYDGISCKKKGSLFTGMSDIV